MSGHTVGAAVIAALTTNDVRHLFGIPGTHNLEIYRYLTGSGISHVVPRHEQGAGYAADGYARTTGRPGVVLTTTGPGLTNAITAIATAYADSVPLLVISPGMPRGMDRADVGWLHEMKDQQATLDAVARSVRCTDVDEIVATVNGAFAEWSVGRPRPIHVEIPVDLLEEPWTPRKIDPLPSPAPHAPDALALRAATTALSDSTRPVIVAGGGARVAADALLALVEALDAPVVTTVNGKGAVDEFHPLAVGAAIRLRATQRLINDADTVLVVGSELGDSDLWGGRLEPSGTVVRVDVDPRQLHKNLAAQVAVHGDAAAVLPALAGAVVAAQRGGVSRAATARAACQAECAEEVTPWRPVNDAVRAAVPGDAIVAGDSSQVTYFGTVHAWPFGRSNRLLYPTGYATLGYGLPAAIGAKIAEPDRAVVAVIGDGAAMFSIQELITAAELGLALPIVIADNGGYGEIRHQMTDRGITPLAVDLARPDFAALADAMGCRGIVARDADEVSVHVTKAFDAERPTVIVLRVPTA